MITYSIIQKSQLEGAKRLDAEYYQPEYLKVADKLKALPHETLENISESLVSFGAYELTNYIEWKESGIPFIVAENVKEGVIDYDGVRFIDEKVDEILQKSRVNDGQVLLSMSGSVGNAAVAVNTPQRLNSNQDIVKITLKKAYSPFFLAAFLNSKYGRSQVLRLPVGSVQQHIFLWQTKTLMVPILPREVIGSIENIYQRGLERLENSKSFYSRAEILLLEELGLKDWIPDLVGNDNEWTVNFSEIKNANRMDAEYFQPKYKKLISVVAKKANIQNLEKIFDFKRGVFIDTSYYTEQKTQRPYIRIKELAEKGGINELEIIYINEKYLDDKNSKLKENDLVVAIIGDTIGKTNRIDKTLSSGYCSNNTARLRVKSDWIEKMLPEYSEILFQSTFIQSQIEQKKAQTGQPKISDNEIRSVKIPVLPKPTQQKIADLVRQSHEARKKAKQLLEEAKHKVEELIEKGAK